MRQMSITMPDGGDMDTDSGSVDLFLGGSRLRGIYRRVRILPDGWMDRCRLGIKDDTLSLLAGTNLANMSSNLIYCATI